jgi:hypothetical protein
MVERRTLGPLRRVHALAHCSMEYSVGAVRVLCGYAMCGPRRDAGMEILTKIINQISDDDSGTVGYPCRVRPPSVSTPSRTG